MCQGCSLPIKDQYIFKVLPDMQWHEQCLKCAECNCHLTETCFIRNSKAYCRQDYFKFTPTQQSPQAKLKLTNCTKCQLPLSRNDLVIKSKERMFHMDCFKCSVCLRKLAPGEEYCHQEESNMLYCKDDVHMGSATIVASSSPKFLGHNNSSNNNHQLYLTTNQRYNQQSSSMAITPENSNSFSPSTTSSSSSSSSSSSVTDSPSNNHSYNLMNSSFQSNQLSYSGLVDMPNNTAVSAVHASQNLGQNTNPIRYDFNQGNTNNNNADNSDAESDDEDQDNEDSEDDDDDENLIDDNDQSLTDDESSFTDKKKKAKKTSSNKGLSNHNEYKSSPDSLLMQINHNHGQYNHNANSGAGGCGGSSGNKPARIRTVLNEKQLHTLRACYGANPRPDALMKEQLVEMTGLNPRVIRVWFQNKRCKDKKKNMLRPPGDVHVTNMQQIGGFQPQQQHHQHQQFNQIGQQPQQHHLQQPTHNQAQYNSHLMFDHCF